MRHHLETHQDKVPMHTFHQVGQYQSSLERQIQESILIDTFGCDNILNGKGEWGANLVPRPLFEDENQTRLNRNRNKPELEPKPDSGSGPKNPMPTSRLENLFQEQLSQRRKKRRLVHAENQNENQKENQKPEGVQVQVQNQFSHSIMNRKTGHEQES